jgi:hypothetical protein
LMNRLDFKSYCGRRHGRYSRANDAIVNGCLMKSNDENEKEQNSLRAQNLFQREPSSGVLRGVAVKWPKHVRACVFGGKIGWGASVFGNFQFLSLFTFSEISFSKISFSDLRIVSAIRA